MGGDEESDKREDKEEESYIEPILLSTRPRQTPGQGADMDVTRATVSLDPRADGPVTDLHAQITPAIIVCLHRTLAPWHALEHAYTPTACSTRSLAYTRHRPSRTAHSMERAHSISIHTRHRH